MKNKEREKGMHCPSCQREHLDGMKFCPVTGVRLSTGLPVKAATPTTERTGESHIPVSRRGKGNPLMSAYVAAFKKYGDFSGRASRPEYWWFILGNIIVAFIVGIIGGMTGSAELASLYQLISMLPATAIATRRLHDVGKSGWHQLWCITIIGSFWVLYLLVQPSQRGENLFGKESEVL